MTAERSSSAPTAPRVKAQAGRYLTVSLSREQYAIQIESIQEVIALAQITPVPQTPPFVKGVFNFRGRILPAVDLRIKFRMKKPVALSDEACIVVLKLERAGKLLEMGMVVNAIREIANVSADQIGPTPDFGMRLDTRYLLGTLQLKEDVALILDVDRALTDQEMRALTDASAAGQRLAEGEPSTKSESSQQE